MKKISILFTILMSVLYFISTFFSMGNDNYLTTNDSSSYFRNQIDKGTSSVVHIDDKFIYDEHALQDLFDVVSKNHAVAHAALPIKGTNAQNYEVYVYAKTDIYKDQFYTKDNIRIDLSDPSEERYYTTVKDDDQVLIDFLNPIYYEYTYPIRIFPFHQMKQLPYLFYIDMSTEEFLGAIEGTKLEEAISSVDVLDENTYMGVIHQEGIQYDPYGILEICLVLSAFVLVLLLMVHVVKNKKYVAVCRLHGFTKTRIIKKTFLSYLLSMFAVYTITQLVLLFTLSGGVREVTKQLYEVILFSILGFGFVLVVLYAILYVYLSTYKNFHDLKQNKINRVTIIFNIVLKIVMSALLIAPMVNLFPDFVSQLKETITLFEYKEDNQYRYKVVIYADETTNVMNGVGSEEILSDIYAYLAKEYDGQIFNNYEWDVNYEMAAKEELDVNYFTPFAYTNQNYLRTLDKIYDEKGNVIDVDGLHSGVMLIPESRKDIENTWIIDKLNEYQCDQIIYVKDFNHDFRPIIYTMKSDFKHFDKFSNPVIYVSDESSTKTAFELVEDMYFKTTDIQKVYDELSKMGYKENVEFVPVKASIDNTLREQFVIFSSTAFMLIGYLVVYLSFVYQSIFVYLDVYKRKLMVKYMNGYSYIKRYFEIYAINLLSYILAGIIAYSIFKVSLIAIIGYIVIFGGIEIVFEAWQIHRFHIKQGISSLKS